MNIDTYIYPAIFTIADDGVSVEFPDLLGCFSCGDNPEDALLMARDALAGHLICLLEDLSELPEPSPISTLKLEPNQIFALIDVTYLSYISEQKSERTTITLPKWIKTLAVERNINLSKVLRDSLLDILGLSHMKDKC